MKDVAEKKTHTHTTKNTYQKMENTEQPPIKLVAVEQHTSYIRHKPNEHIIQ